MKISQIVLTAAILSTLSLTARAQQFRYATNALTVSRAGHILTATDASGMQVANIDLTKRALKGKVVAFAYSSKKKVENKEVAESVTRLTIFPNPASKQVQLDLKGDWKFPLNVHLFDRSGNSVQHARIEHAGMPLDIATLRQGIYILKAESGQTSAVEKLIVE